MMHYGPQYARLRSPQGYRGNQNAASASWISVDFGKRIVVTSIALQGYGNASVQEWVTQFILLYSKDGSDFLPFQHLNSQSSILEGNDDSSSIKRIVLTPVIADKVKLMPIKWNHNVGLRIELFGCKPDFYFTLTILFAKRQYTMALRDTKSYEYKVAKEEALSETEIFLNQFQGFLEIKFKGLSPMEKRHIDNIFTAVEFHIYCMKSSLQIILTRLKELVRDSDLFEPDFFRVRYPGSDVCPTPIFNLLPTTFNNSKNLTILKGSSPLFKAHIEYKCKVNSLLILWKVGSVHKESGLLSPLQQLSPVNSPSMTIKSNKFKDSLIFFQCNIFMTIGKESNFMQDYRFITIINAQLYSQIEGPNFGVRGARNITLDGTKSRADGDALFLKNLNMKFAWFCQLQKLGEKKLENKNCFGGSISDPVSSKKTFEVDVNRFTSVRKYYIKLVVSSDDISSVAKSTITVSTYQSFLVSCITNCLAKINVKSKQVLRAECIGAACTEIRNYEWKFHLLDKTTRQWKAIMPTSKCTSVLEAGATFVINNMTELIGFMNSKDESLNVSVTAHFNSYSSIMAEKQFVLNAIPKRLNGSDCIVAPKEGLGMDTYFNISCMNWRDEDVPLTFKFQYISDFGLLILQTGYAFNISTQLLPGNKEFGYMQNVMTVVTDAYGASETQIIPIKVNVPSEAEATSKIKNIDGELDDLLKNGNSGKAADMSLYALSLMNAYKQDVNREKKVKDDIMYQMRASQVESIAMVSKCGAIVKSATNQSEELSRSSQDDALTIIEKVSNAMKTEIVSNGTSALTSDVVEYFAQDLINGLSNVLDPTFVKQISAGPSFGNERIDMTNLSSQEITRRSVATTTQVAQNLASLTAVGDEPKVIRSKNVVVRVEKNIPSSFSGKMIEESDSLIVLPPLNDMLSNVNGTLDVMGCQVIEYSSNPFNWHTSSTSVSTAVVDISIQKGNGIAIKVDSLDNPINLFLPRKIIANPNLDARYIQDNFFLKPIESIGDLNKADNINYHKIVIPNQYVTVTIILVPDKGQVLEVLIQSGAKPTPFHYNFTTRVPDLSTCNKQSIGTFKRSLCQNDPYKIDVTSSLTGSTGLHYIGIRVLSKIRKTIASKRFRRSSYIIPKIRLPREAPDDKVKIDLKNNFKKNKITSADVTRYKRSCIGMKDPVTPPPELKRPIYNPKTDVKYKLNSYLSACLFWSEEKQAWDSKGCKLGHNSNSTHVHCLCQHMTAFGGDFFVAPNPIDFDHVMLEFARMQESGNYVVLSTVSLLWVAFVIGLMFARRADLKDKRKIINCTINQPDEFEDKKTIYKISIQTGLWFGSGTTASVGLILHGMDQSVPIYFNNDDYERQLFARGSVNSYWITVPESLGELFKIKLWHTNAGKSPEWFVKDIVISDESGSDQWYFLVNRWLAVDKDGVTADVLLTGEKEPKKLKYRFYSRAAEQFTDAHLWFSLFTKSVHSHFTRCQRLSCCFLILTSTMVTNAMFYRLPGTSGRTFFIGPFEINSRAIKTGMQTAIIILPITVVVTMIFEKVKSKRTVLDKGVVLQEENVQGFISRRFIPVAWLLSIGGSILSSVFTVFYSLMWGAEIANQWILSTLISFIQDVLINEPIKIILIVSLLAMLIKKPIDSRQNVTESVKRDTLKSEAIEFPFEENLTKDREMKQSQSRARRFLVELGYYIAFVILVFVVCYQDADKQRFDQTISLSTLVKSFHQVSDTQSFWRWLENDALSFLYSSKWYNGQKSKGPEGYISNKKHFLIGMPRIRQLRVKPDFSCLDKTSPLLRQYFDNCLPEYSVLSEDSTPYSLAGWQPAPTNITEYLADFNKKELCPKPWRYSSFRLLQTLPLIGSDILYGGGGFVADLGYNKITALNVVAKLKENAWIDKRTAAVFVEFTVFSPSTLLFSSVKLLLERFSSGSTNRMEHINTILVYSSPNKPLLRVCQFFLLILILVAIAMELKAIFKKRKSYFKEPWNLVQWLQISSVTTTLFTFHFKQSYTREFLMKIRANPFKTSSIDFIVLWSSVETLLLSFVIFILTIKLIRILRFHHFIRQFTNCLKGLRRMLVPLGILFLVQMTGLSFMANILFGCSSYNFSSFPRTFIKLVSLLSGGKLFQKESHFAESPYGLLFVIFYTFTSTVILFNVFISAIMESIDRVKYAQINEDFDLKPFIKNWFTSLLERNKKVRKRKRSLREAKIWKSVTKQSAAKVLLHDIEVIETRETSL